MVLGGKSRKDNGHNLRLGEGTRQAILQLLWPFANWVNIALKNVDGRL